MADDRNDEAEKPKSWWLSLPGLLTALAGLLSAAAALLVALHQIGVFTGPRPAPAASDAPAVTLTGSPPAVPASPASSIVDDRTARYRVSLPSGASVVLPSNRGVATYQVLGVQAERRGADKLTFKISIRLSNAGPADVGFWNDTFRLLVDGVPRAPVSFLNTSVEARAAKDAEVEFEVPLAAKTLALQIADEKNGDTLPLRLERQD